MWTAPVDSTEAISVDTVIHVLFSELVDSVSVASGGLAVSGGVTGQITFNGNLVIYTPNSSLAYATEYTVTVSTAVTDAAGNHLASDYVWSFTTQVDPALLPPAVISTVPTNGAVDHEADRAISATFSKGIDGSTVTTSSFSINNGVTGSVSVSGSTATFTPDDTLEYNTNYTATITTAVADTFGLNVASNYQWSFTTGDNPMIPVAFVFWPQDSAIVGDTVTVEVSTYHPIGVDSVEFYVDGALTPTFSDNTEPFEFYWDLSGYTVGSEHTVYSVAYEASGLTGYSDTTTIAYQWEELMTDINDFWRTDIRRVLARSTDSLLELRYEFWEPWMDPYDAVPDDTTLDLGIYFDTDRNPLSGRTDFDTKLLNGIGADYRLLFGLHGIDTVLSSWNPDLTRWELIYDITGLAYYNYEPYATVLEIGVRWEDLFWPNAIDLVSINLFWIDHDNFYDDWVPDRNTSHLTVIRDDRYIGEGYVEPPAKRAAPHSLAVPDKSRENPWDAD